MGEGYDRFIRTADTRRVYPRCSPELDSWGHTARIAGANSASWCLSVPKPRMAPTHQISLPGPGAPLSLGGSVVQAGCLANAGFGPEMMGRALIKTLPATFREGHHLLAHRAADSTARGLLPAPLQLHPSPREAQFPPRYSEVSPELTKVVRISQQR